MNYKIIFPLLLILTSACNRTDKNENTAGKGGAATLHITPQHHGKNIKNATIYIKYNATDAPASFDDSAKCVLADTVPVASFTQLKTGNYYLYGKGYDSAILQTVEGGINYRIEEEKEISIFIPVTEGD